MFFPFIGLSLAVTWGTWLVIHRLRPEAAARVTVVLLVVVLMR